MRFSLLFKKRINVLSIILVLFLTTLSSLAEENSISSVVISKSKDLKNGYELSIDSTQTSSYKTRVINDDSVIFELKNAVLADGAATYYDDVENIDSVALKQTKNNRVQIFVQGQNVKNTDVVFENSLFEATSEKTKKINVNQPINQYQPTNHLNDVDDESLDQDWDDNSFSMSNLVAAMLKNLREGFLGIALIFLLVLFMMVITIKMLAKKFQQEREPLIGLNNSYQYKHDAVQQIHQAVQMPDEDEELQPISRKSEILKNAQSELAKAHQKYQTYLQNKYKNNYQEKINSVNIDAVKKSIALNQYQKSTQNPYKDQEVLKMNNDFAQRNDNSRDNFQIPPRPKKVVTENFSTPYIKRNSSDLKPDTIIKQPQGSMKFLESVSKIYEQSGRGDLAQDLKNKIYKAKQVI